MDGATEARLAMQTKITSINANIQYFNEQVQMAWKEVCNFEKAGDFKGYVEAQEAYKEHLTNLNSERKVKALLEAKLNSGNYSLDTESLAGTKRKAS